MTQMHTLDHGGTKVSMLREYSCLCPAAQFCVEYIIRKSTDGML